MGRAASGACKAIPRAMCWQYWLHPAPAGALGILWSHLAPQGTLRVGLVFATGACRVALGFGTGGPTPHAHTGRGRENASGDRLGTSPQELVGRTFAPKAVELDDPSALRWRSEPQAGGIKQRPAYDWGFGQLSGQDPAPAGVLRILRNHLAPQGTLRVGEALRPGPSCSLSIEGSSRHEKQT